ncbi:MAG: hypothetical protein JWQ87_5584 [Candidatus Sulfotelmatobacter sp.]|nr:hypothetical protein [Candidatus Sulfotelmatobacter sp.]
MIREKSCLLAETARPMGNYHRLHLASSIRRSGHHADPVAPELCGDVFGLSIGNDVSR